MPVKIVTDSAADLPGDQAAAHDIALPQDDRADVIFQLGDQPADHSRHAGETPRRERTADKLQS